MTFAIIPRCRMPDSVRGQYTPLSSKLMQIIETRSVIIAISTCLQFKKELEEVISRLLTREERASSLDNPVAVSCVVYGS